MDIDGDRAQPLEIYNMAGHLIRRLNQISTSVFHDRMVAAGETLTPVQFAALNALRHRPGIDQRTLAGLIAHDRATIGGVVERLEAKGYVARRVRRQDRRARELVLTALGAETLERVIPLVRALQADILSGLSGEETAQFLRLATKITIAGNHLSRAPLSDANSTT